MSEVLDPEVQPATEPEPVAPAPAQEDDSVEVSGVKMVPLVALQSIREELKAAKPLAEKAQQLEQQNAQMKPYVEFLAQNPHLLQPQAPQQFDPPPAEDPALVELARTLDLYDSKTGQPDVVRAAKIRDHTAAIAQQAAQQAVAPVQHTTNERQAAANLKHIMDTSKVNGKPLDQKYLMAAVNTIRAGVPPDQAMHILADKTVANILRLTAQGLQAEADAGAPPTPQLGAPLHVEAAGGGTGQYQLSELSRRLARDKGMTEQQYADRAKAYVPGKPNVLE